MKTLFFLAVLFPIALFSQTTLTEKLNSYMDAQHAVNQFGGTVLVMRNDSVLLKKAYGYSNYEWEVANTIDTKFGLASITKHITAIAILQLAEKGKLSTDDKLMSYFPEFPKGDSVTIHMLLTHTSGLPVDFEDLYLDHTSISKDSAIKILQNRPYSFGPGAKCGYSNTGYFLLSKIIEIASGETYAEYLQNHIFSVAGMHNSGVSNNDSIVSKMAHSYYRTESGFLKNPYINWNLCIGLDGMYSTAEDLYKLDRALYGESVLNENSKTRMNTQYNKKFPDNGFFENYGYGVLINPYYNHGHYLLTHNGGFYGVMTSFDRFTRDNVFITVLSNNQSESNSVSYGLSAIVFGIPVEQPRNHSSISVDPALFEKYSGKYGRITIINADKKLYFRNTDTELLPESQNIFFRADGSDSTVEFVTNKKGIVTSIILTRGGVKEEIKKDRIQ